MASGMAGLDKDLLLSMGYRRNDCTTLLAECGLFRSSHPSSHLEVDGKLCNKVF
jgi:hypothetical protein